MNSSFRRLKDIDRVWEIDIYTSNIFEANVIVWSNQCRLIVDHFSVCHCIHRLTHGQVLTAVDLDYT